MDGVTTNTDGAAGGETTTTPTAAERITRALTAGVGGGGADKPTTTTTTAAKDDTSAADDATAPPQQQQQTAADDTMVKMSDVQKMIADEVKKGIATVKGEQTATDTRNRFLITKMGDLPPVMLEMMPKTGDLKELAKAEQDIREQFKSWFTAELARNGQKYQAIGGNVASSGSGGGGAVSPIDASFSGKVTPTQRVHQALNGRR